MWKPEGQSGTWMTTLSYRRLLDVKANIDGVSGGAFSGNHDDLSQDSGLIKPYFFLVEDNPLVDAGATAWCTSWVPVEAFFTSAPVATARITGICVVRIIWAHTAMTNAPVFH